MHPLNKKNFGAKAGKLAVKFYDGSSIKTGWVLAQVGSVRYKVTDGTTTKIARLCQTTAEVTALTAGTGPAASLRATLCTIEITPYGGSVENIRKMSTFRVFTVQGSHVVWKLGTTATAAGHGTIAIVANAAPVVANVIPNQTATVAGAFSFQFAANTFSDLNKDTLTYTSTLGDNSALPGWLVFTPATRTFTKAAAAGTAGAITVKVVASDGTLTASNTFTLTVS
jgi:hypothetical protein